MFSNLDEVRINASGVEESTRTHLIDVFNELVDAHGNCMWCSNTWIDIFTSFALVCSRYGYTLEYERDDDVLIVRVNLDETL